MLAGEVEGGEAALSSDDLAQFVDRLAAVDDNAGDADSSTRSPNWKE